MKISKDTFLVILTAEQAKALALFIGPLSAEDAKEISNKYCAGSLEKFNALNKTTDFLFHIFQQVKDA